MAALAAAPAAAGAWLQERGEGLLILTQLLDRAEGYFDQDGVRQAEGFFYKDEVAAYVEYGLSDDYTLVTRLAWQSVEQSFGGAYDQASGLAASELAVRRALWRRNNEILSAQLGLFLPGEGENIANQPLGDGDLSGEVRLLAGRGFSSGGFSELQLAYRQRGGRYLDEWRLDAGIGAPVRENLMAMVSAYSVWSAEAARPGVPEFQQTKIQMSAVIGWGDLDVEIGGFFTPTGESALDERALFLSVWRRF